MTWRYSLIIPIAALAYLAGANAVVNATRVGAPGTALAIDASDGGALVAQSNQKWAAGVQQGKVLDLSGAARKALRTAPLSGGALRLMGYGADTKGDAKRAERLNLLATKVTQREKGAQLWLMEAAVARNDIKGALARYDFLLATDNSVRDQLFRQLALALADPEIRVAFIPYIRKAPSWLLAFVSHAVGNSPAPEVISYTIRQASGLPKTKDARGVETALLSRLFAMNKFAEARAFYGTLDGSNAKVAVSTAFDDESTNVRFAPMTWAIERSANAGADFSGKGEDRSVRAFALSGEAGTVAYKHLFLAPGTYRFVTAQQIITNSANARATWVVRCMTDAQQAVLYQHAIIRGTRAAAPSGTFTVPTSCTAQRLDLSLTGGDDSSGLELNITGVGIGI